MQRARGIDGARTLFDMANDAVFVDNEGDAIGEQACEVEHAVRPGHLFIGVTEQGKAGLGLVGEPAIALRAIDADPQNLCICCLEFGDITLIRPDFGRSTRRGRANVERQHHGFLAAKARQLDDIAVLVR